MSEEKTDNVNIIDIELERLHLDLRHMVNYAITDCRRATKREALNPFRAKIVEKIMERISILEDHLIQ